MVENHRRNIPFKPPDSTATSSDSSGVTVESSGGQAEGAAKINADIDIIRKNCWQSKDHTLKRGLSGLADKFMVWTDEKHNSYLDVLEATFVKQLHQSMSLCGRKSQEVQAPLTQLLARERESSDQFMVLQDGTRQQRNSEIREPLLDSTADSNNVRESPRVYFFASKGQQNSAMFSHPQEKIVHEKAIYLRSNMDLCLPERIPKQHPECYRRQSFSVSTAEVSGQNFVDEEQVKKDNSVSRAKRTKTTTVDVSGCNQVVSRGYDCSTDSETEASSKCGKRKLRPEQQKSLSTSNSEMNYFLRGS